jgi:hypothetical protein
VQASGAAQRAADLGNRHGGIMRIKRTIIVPAVLALGVVGSLLSGSAMSVTVGHAPAVHVQAGAASANPNMVYHG